jgi:hypothetical protein
VIKDPGAEFNKPAAKAPSGEKPDVLKSELAKAHPKNFVYEVFDNPAVAETS